MFVIDKLAYSSKLRYKSPILKVLFTLGSLLICVAAGLFIVSAIILVVMAGLTLSSSKASFQRYIKLMCIPLGFLLLSTIAVMINITDAPMDLFSIDLGGKYLAVSYDSMKEAGRLVMVAMASVSCLYFLTLTTPLIDILVVLQKLRCPKIMIELMMLIYRYIFVVLDMASAIRTSQNCRLGNKDFITDLHSIGQMLSVLLIRSLKKSSQLFDAMESRCYNGEIHVLNEYYPAETRDTIFVTGFLLVLLTIAVFFTVEGGVF